MSLFKFSTCRLVGFPIADMLINCFRDFILQLLFSTFIFCVCCNFFSSTTSSSSDDTGTEGARDVARDTTLDGIPDKILVPLFFSMNFIITLTSRESKCGECCAISKAFNPSFSCLEWISTFGQQGIDNFKMTASDTGQ